MRKLSIKILLLASFIIFLLILPTPNSQLPSAFAQSNPCLDITNPRAGGLVSTPTLGGIFTTSAGVCVIDPAAQLGPHILCVIDYNCLRSTFYDQARDNPTLFINKNNPLSAPGPYSQTNIPMSTSEDQLWNVQASLNLASAPSGSRSGVVFVDGNLTVTGDIIYGTTSSGLVFVVQGNVNIVSGVNRVDAVIISAGTIDTGTSSSQLIINGSLISINPSSGPNILFRRDLGSSNSTDPAERVVYQPKYLVILANLFTTTDQKWSELAGRINVPSPAAGIPPGPPTNVIATPGNGSATVTWQTPTDAGTSPITKYTITTTPATPAIDPAISPQTVSGLTNGQQYTINVFAHNSTGPGSPGTATVTPSAFDYSLAASSSSVSVVAGSSVPNTITRNLLGTTQSVSLTASGLPSGASPSFTNNPCNPTCSSTLTIFTSGFTPVGGSTITVTGSPLNRATTFALNVNCAPISWYPDSDFDGYGNQFSSPTTQCNQPAGNYVANEHTDCYDGDNRVHPNAGPQPAFFYNPNIGSYSGDWNCVNGFEPSPATEYVANGSFGGMCGGDPIRTSVNTTPTTITNVFECGSAVYTNYQITYAASEDCDRETGRCTCFFNSVPGNEGLGPTQVMCQ